MAIRPKPNISHKSKQIGRDVAARIRDKAREAEVYLRSLTPEQMNEMAMNAATPGVTLVRGQMLDDMLRSFLSPGGHVLGRGADFTAKKIGPYVVKMAGGERSVFGVKIPDLERLADAAPAVTPPTQYAQGPGGRHFLIQEYVQPPKPYPNIERNEMIRFIVDGLRNTPAAPAPDLRVVGNVLYGTARGRTQPWLPDVGSLIPRSRGSTLSRWGSDVGNVPYRFDSTTLSGGGSFAQQLRQWLMRHP